MSTIVPDPYTLGLWCADKYWWSSSIGISNTDAQLVKRFAEFLLKVLPEERLRLRIYFPPDSSLGVRPDRYLLNLVGKVSVTQAEKLKKIGYHLYVNSRPLLRIFRAAEMAIAEFKAEQISAYLAGRFDGDGSINPSMEEEFRIVYTTIQEARQDRKLLERIGIKQVSVYAYRKINTYALYVKKDDVPRLVRLLKPYSLKLSRLSLPRRD